jgi:hypothetical protein
MVEAGRRLRPGGACDWWPRADLAEAAARTQVRLERVRVSYDDQRRAGQPVAGKPKPQSTPLEPVPQEWECALLWYRNLVRTWQADGWRLVAGRQRYTVTLEDGEEASQEVDCVLIDLRGGERRMHGDYVGHDAARLDDAPPSPGGTSPRTAKVRTVRSRSRHWRDRGTTATAELLPADGAVVFHVLRHRVHIHWFHERLERI